ncbi:hypothetical protein [Roseomonas fluvialis]|uniref:EF-hand domain-containing protein n=1 Tax=Roseomonas fluvialis TaxID=1750527 RepID=A0ABM7Y4E3_9PROT|nr:hypothetical protein [Roseomonas fluvialis]BDG72779.1 hypothetical protein Rmf_27080 [Roseomonas fluvialis]
MKTIEWVTVPGIDGRAIGAIGFIGDDAAIVTAFFDDRDGNKDGEVSWGEWAVSKISPISVEGKAVTEVAMAARYMPEIVMRDASFAQEAAQMYVEFAKGLVVDGIYAAYFSRGVSAAAGATARAVGGGMVREFFIREGMKKAVREIYDASVGR